MLKTWATIVLVFELAGAGGILGTVKGRIGERVIFEPCFGQTIIVESSMLKFTNLTCEDETPQIWY